MTLRERFWKEFAHAFAVDAPATIEPTPAQAALVDRVCREVVRRRLTTPALVTLEMSRPLNFVTAQAIHFFDPMLRTFGDVHAPREFATFLEHRGSIDYLAKRLEAMEADLIQPEATRRKSSNDDDPAQSNG